MVILPLAGIAYGLVTFWFARRIFKQCKIDAYKTASGRRKFQRYQGKYSFFSLLAGYFWPVLCTLAFLIVLVKGIIWIVSIGQEIPAERQEKIEALEKELFPEEKQPEDAKPNYIPTLGGWND